MSDLARKKLISSLESVFHEHIINNDKQIRYPITFKDNSKLKGKYILRVSESNDDIFFSGRYQFGANALYVYKTIDTLLRRLQRQGLIDEFALDNLLEEYREELEQDNEA